MKIKFCSPRPAHSEASLDSSPTSNKNGVAGESIQGDSGGTCVAAHSRIRILSQTARVEVMSQFTQLYVVQLSCDVPDD